MTARQSTYEVAHVDDLDSILVAHGLQWRPIRRRFDVRAFGINAYTSDEVGSQVVEEHTESQLGHEEIYLVLRGSATFTLGDEDVDVPAGSLVHISDPEVRRVAISREPDTTVLALGGKPGEPYQVSAWEAMFAAVPAGRAPRCSRSAACSCIRIAANPCAMLSWMSRARRLRSSRIALRRSSRRIRSTIWL